MATRCVLLILSVQSFRPAGRSREEAQNPLLFLVTKEEMTEVRKSWQDTLTGHVIDSACVG